MSSVKPGARAPIDLSARLASLVDHRHGNAMRGEHARGRNPGRTGADDRDSNHGAKSRRRAGQDVHAVGDDRRAGAHARPSASHTQQSWQAPIRQKPARGSSLNSCRRSALRAASTATSTLSPA